MSLFKEKGDSRERCSFRAIKLMEQPLKIVEGVWAAVFTFNPYLLISINELMISIIHLLISINKAASVIFIDINK